MQSVFSLPAPVKSVRSLLLTMLLLVFVVAPVCAQAPGGAGSTPAAGAESSSPAGGAGQPNTQPSQLNPQVVLPKVVPPPTPPFPLSIEKVTPADDKAEAGLGDKIIVKVKNLREELARQRTATNIKDEERLNPGKFVLFLNDIEIKGLNPQVLEDTSELKFTLDRSSDSRDAWRKVLAHPKEPSRRVAVTVGEPGKTPLKSDQGFTFRLYYPWLLYLAIALFVIFLVGFCVAVKKTTIIRDSGPAAPVDGPLTRPYSLARAQVAWWFFLILAAFLFIDLVTWDIDTISTSALVLLGIGTGTALGAAMVDSNKRETATGDLRTLRPQQAKLAAAIEELQARIRRADIAVDENSLVLWRTDLAAKEAEFQQVTLQADDAAAGLEKPVSAGFLNDILSDVNGVTFHRFQVVVWTIVLGLIFIWEVWTKLAMPTFTDTQLALMGISAGTYIGFKIPERQTKPEDAQQ
jgi:hypothetical protein